MSSKETQRALRLQEVKSGVITLKKASKLLDLSYPQTKRLWSKFKNEGPKGLISKKRGRKSNRAVPHERRQEIAKIINENYYECKPLFVSEKLEERHNIKFSSEFIRQLMTEYQLWFPNASKASIHQRRERRECEGELVQMDASNHDWFEGRAPKCHLHLLIDDATSRLHGGYFTPEETTEGYFRACLSYFEREGLPVSFYNDKRGTFIVNQGENRGETQFARAMKELGIKMIFAHSPQAKGRIERAFGTLQERLIWEMRIANISSIKEANEFLPSFIEKHNKKFAVESANPFNAHRQLDQSKPLKYILCNKEERKVTKNLEIQYQNMTYQLLPAKGRSDGLKKAKVDVLTTLDGEIRLEHKGQNIEYKRFEGLPYWQKDVEVDQALKFQEKNEEPKRVFTNNKKLFCSVENRGYVEREEVLNLEEREAIVISLEKRRQAAREENLEILEEERDGTNG